MKQEYPDFKLTKEEMKEFDRKGKKIISIYIYFLVGFCIVALSKTIGLFKTFLIVLALFLAIIVIQILPFSRRKP